MQIFLDILLDALVDTTKLVPFLFVTYWVMELIEGMASERSSRAIEQAGHAGPLVGGLLGAVPQCGFSAAASTLYAGRVITLGTLFAVFLSTSDEMLPIFIAESADPAFITQVILLKILIGITMGFAVDAVMRLANRGGDRMRISELCERDHCECEGEEGSPLRSAVRHTLQVTLFIFLITLALAAAIELVGQDALAAFLQGNPVLSVVAAAVVGLIPNCAASVALTELYLSGALSFAAMMAGLLVSAGVGLLVLLRTNRRLRENLLIVAILLATGVTWGLIFLFLV